MIGKAVALACVLGGVLASAAFGQERQFLVTVAPKEAPHGYEKVSISKAVLGSTPIRLWFNTAINPDCSVQGTGASLTILAAPSHGVVTVSDEPLFISFPVSNPRSACNNRKVPGHQAFYTAAAGFTGHDRLVLQGASPDGQVRRIDVNVDVR